MSYKPSSIHAELSAVNAAHDQKERIIRELTDLPLEDESVKFKLSPHSETQFVQLPKDLVELGYTLSLYNIDTRPKGVKGIIKIEASQVGKGLYRVTYSSYTMPDRIQQELEKSLLPF